MDLALSDMNLDASILAAIHEMMDFNDETPADVPHRPSRTFVRNNKAVKNTAADILEYPNSYEFIVDMPGVKPENIKVQVEDGNVLVVSGERGRDKDREQKEGVKYIRMERRQGKFLKKFELPEDVILDSIQATYEHGVLTITVEKKPSPEQKRLRNIEVKVGSGRAQVGGGSGQGSDFGEVKVHQQQQQQQVDESLGAQVGDGTAESQKR